VTVDVLAIGAHPDDVELGCGGSLALLAELGHSVGILHLTSGEAGTRGTPEKRRQEALEAARALGTEEPVFLDCGDGALRRGRTEEEALIGQLRQLRPRLVFAPAPQDRHPDHGRAHRLVIDACFYAGLAERCREVGPGPHRPAAVFAYMQHDSFTPSFVVDVSGVWERKMAALDCYRSQLFGAGSEARLPPTKTASPDFRAAIEGRARHFGLAISATYGEPFLSAGPLPCFDPWSLLPRGQR